jgi:hypothetical protein
MVLVRAQIGSEHLLERPRWSGTRCLLVLASPLLVIAVGWAAAHLFTSLLGRWAWLGTELVYWGLLIGVVLAFGAKDGWLNGLQRRGSAACGWSSAVGVGLLSFPFLQLPNLGLLASPDHTAFDRDPGKYIHSPETEPAG